MARLFFPTSRDTVTCKRCGSDIPGDADTCPHCGADHGPSFGAAKSAALSSGLRMPFGARREVLNIQSPYPGVPEISELADTGEQRWDASKIVTLGVVALVLVAGGIIYSQHNSGSDDAARSQAPARHSEYGVIDMKTAQGTPAPAVTPAPTVAPDKSIAAVSPAQAVPAPSIAARESLPTAEPSGRSKAALANAADNLQATRDAIGRADLTSARKRYSKIPASQLGSAYAQRTLADLTAQEHARDQMLQAARDCAATGSWLCVRQNAHDALAIDASNLEAQALVERAISRSGWLNKTAPATTTAAHGATHNKTQTVAVAPAAPAPVFVPGPHVAATHKPTATASAAEHARAVAAMAVPSPVTTRAPVAAVAPAAPVVATTMRTPAATQAAPEPARAGTGSQAQLTSAPYPPPPPPPQQAAPPRAPIAAFIPMPDGPEAMPATAPERSVPATAQVPGDTASPLVVPRPLAPNSNTVPARAAVVSPPVAANVPPAGVQGMTRQASPTVRRTIASGDNAASAAQPHASAFNASDPDEEERAILQSGWSKKPSSAQRATSQ